MQGFVLEVSHVKLILNYGASCEVDWIGWTEKKYVIAEPSFAKTKKKYAQWKWRKEKTTCNCSDKGRRFPQRELYMWQAEKMK